jgi:hypothetical protein
MPETGAQTKDIFYYFIILQWSILTSNSMAYALLESSLKKKKARVKEIIQLGQCHRTEHLKLGFLMPKL